MSIHPAAILAGASLKIVCTIRTTLTSTAGDDRQKATRSVVHSFKGK